MTQADLEEAIAVAGFNPREFFREDGITYLPAAELRKHPAIESVEEHSDGGVSIKLKDKMKALTALCVYLGLHPDLDGC